MATRLSIGVLAMAAAGCGRQGPELAASRQPIIQGAPATAAQLLSTVALVDSGAGSSSAPAPWWPRTW
ncbi:MAG: hypothetical protein R3F43_01580 [bacterium]